MLTLKDFKKILSPCGKCITYWYLNKAIFTILKKDEERTDTLLNSLSPTKLSDMYWTHAGDLVTITQIGKYENGNPVYRITTAIY